MELSPYCATHHYPNKYYEMASNHITDNTHHSDDTWLDGHGSVCKCRSDDREGDFSITC